MVDCLKEFRDKFVKSSETIADISKYGDIPNELIGEDVCDYFFLFKNEDVAVDYVINNYGAERNTVLQDLHEEDKLREEYGIKNYLRSARISYYNLYINELLDGTYILWKAY